jgi:ATP-dependent Lon protease
MFEEWDINIHVPEGAVPKDGPSAGITMVTSIASTYTGREVKERIAMTGETTLRGRVTAVGGIREKILAAKRAGIQELILSEGNRKDIEEMLGKPKFRNDRYDIAGMCGVVTGLAWTQVGGDILYVESILTPGKGKLNLTGNLGDVMKESATIAYEWVKAHHEDLGIDRKMFEEWDINIHVPEGAVPKDGPSAGITMVTSITSTFTRREVKERIAMTGETTLRGRVTAVGGIREKILAAKRAGITELILSDENRKDIKKIRAELNKERMAFAEEFTVVKAEVLGPWQAVEDAYKENVQSKYKEADAALKVKIDEIEPQCIHNDTKA